MSVKKITVDEAKEIEGDALILMGCGGDVNVWKEGINELLKEEGIIGESMNDIFILNIQAVRTDLIFMFNETVNTGKLALWRISKGQTFNAKWLSDYMDNEYYLN